MDYREPLCKCSKIYALDLSYEDDLCLASVDVATSTYLILYQATVLHGAFDFLATASINIYYKHFSSTGCTMKSLVEEALAREERYGPDIRSYERLLRAPPAFQQALGGRRAAGAAADLKTNIKIIGCGGGGTNTINRTLPREFPERKSMQRTPTRNIFWR